MNALPDRIGRYEVLNLLGQGGMGVLYLARDPVIDRHVALKLLKVDNEDLRRRFVREARSAGRLQHPNIVTVYDVGDHDGELFIAMEYIDGDTLATLIRDEVPFSTVRKLEMLDQLADGLGFAHHRNIIHRDIKPANLMVTRGGLLKVLDFGIARIASRQAGVASLQSGALIGTPAYMAPEQLEGAEVDHRADIFAVGLVMYELLSGRRAFGGATTADVLQNVLRAEPTPLETLVPSLDPDLSRCVVRALAKRPEERYQDLQDLRNDLGRVRRRSEMESGAFDATIVVQLPPSRPVQPPPPLPSSAPVVPIDTRPATTAGEPDLPAAGGDEADVLRHFASGAGRQTRPVSVPANIDETIYAGVSAPAVSAPVPSAVHPTHPPMWPPGAEAGGPDQLTIVAPVAVPPLGPAAEAVPLPLVSLPPSGIGATSSPPAPVRRSMLPALVAVGVVVLLLAVVAIGALWWVRARLLERFAPDAPTEARVERPGPSTNESVPPPSTVTVAPPADVAENPSPGAPTSPTEDAVVTEPAVPMPAAPPAAPVQPPPGRPSTSARSTEAPVRPTREAPRADIARPPATVPVSPPPVAVTDDDVVEPGAVVRRDAAPVEVARDDALALVRAYVAARNTAHAAGLRRVWPSVTDVEVRRMTGEFSAPLTLTGCDVGAATGARIRANCQFTQPGTTGFSQGTSLNIRRQLVFEMERQGRGWVIVRVAG